MSVILALLLAVIVGIVGGIAGLYFITCKNAAIRNMIIDKLSARNYAGGCNG